MNVTGIRLEQVTRFYMRGSALKGTMTGGCLGLETTIHLESPEPAERVAHLIRMGEQTCFTLGALTEPVPVQTRATLNGSPLELDGEP